VQVAGLSNVTALGVGLFHGCAVVSGGTIACWGDNSSGELGNGGAAVDTCQPDWPKGLACATKPVYIDW
jgi:hypothetical protein